VAIFKRNNHLATEVTAAGLNPRIGLMHRGRRDTYALVCDLQEEFRHLVDAQVWSMIHRREVKPDDFAPSRTGRYPCLMRRDLRRRFILSLERRLNIEFVPPGESESMSYRAFMGRQALRLKEYIQGTSPSYEPLRMQG